MMISKKMQIYIAGPLYTPADREYLKNLDSLCKAYGFNTYLPHRDGGLAPANGSETIPFFKKDVSAIENSDIILAVLNGNDVDSGTAWELGYGYSKGKILLGIYEDTRVAEPLSYYNLMITTSTKIFDSRILLSEKLKSIQSKNKIEIRQKIDDRDIQVILRAIIKLPLEIDVATSESFGYSNPVLCCLDAILSINRPYHKFVKPRVQDFAAKYPDVINLKDLMKLLNSLSEQEFGKEYLNYDHADRITILKNFVGYLIENAINSTKSELAALKYWAQESGVFGYKIMNIKGIGIATYQYFRMLVGVNTIKPDIHITSFINGALNKRVSAEYCIILLEQLSKRLSVEAISLDHSLWRLYSLKEN